MNTWKYLKRSLLFYKQTNLWVILGTIVSSAILIGALIIGDSVHYSLQHIVLNRLGKTQYALSSGDRFFKVQLAQKLTEKMHTIVAPVLQTKGIAIVDGGQQRVNNVQVIGVNRQFAEIGGFKGTFDNISSDEAIINTRIAKRLNVSVGDDFLLRIENLDFIPKDIPLALDSETSLANRFTVKKIISEKEFGRFNLRADQITPYNIFLSLDFLNKEMELDNKANVLLVAENPNNKLTLEQINDVFKVVWTLPDVGFEFVELSETEIELKSERIFLEPPIATGISSTIKNPQKIFTYFINELHSNEKATPYSFVSGISDLDLKDDEIFINQWLANDLAAKSGDQIELTYYVLSESRSLEETTVKFIIKSIVPMRGIYADKQLMPDFPGMVNEENCRDWDPGIPIDLDKIRDKDEKYWDDYKGTPKAFISLNAAQTLWQNRFGNLTAIRFINETKENLEINLTKTIEPRSLGFFFRDVKTEGFNASSQSIDFAQLFLGLSFFIILAALLLTGLLFVFNIESRSQENGLFLALGFTKKTTKKLILLEGMFLVIIGTVLGAMAAIFYNQIVMFALKTIWQDIIGTSSIQMHIKISTIFIGIGISILVTFITIWLVARNQFKKSVSGLQKGTVKLESIKIKKSKLNLIICVISILGVLVIIFFSNPGKGQEAFAAFFSAGFLLLIGSVAFANIFILKNANKINIEKLSLINIGIRNNIRKRFRSLSLIVLLASGLFIVFTVGANRKSSSSNAEKRESGTGGFALFGKTVLPILYDLNSEKGRDFYTLSEVNSEKVKFVPFRVKEGDDASCLNLNRISTPQVIGVNPEELTKRKSFTFVKTTNEVDQENPWEVLKQEFSNDVIPGIADQTVIIWGLGKSVGDTLDYVDEHGNPFKIKLVGGLANSIYQGNIIISENAFIEKYPSISGSRIFLVDAPFSGIEDISQKISWSLQDQGVEITPTYERLDLFSQVENTYLSIFMILGTFGLIIGCIGIGIVIWRNVAERQGELALLRSVGFNKKAIQKMILSEHFILIIAGILFGIVAAVVATLPSMMTPGSNIPFSTIFVLLLFVVINGGIWSCFATTIATKKELLPALRNE